MPAQRKTDKQILSNLDGQCEIIAAGQDPVFMDAEPDQWTAYARVRFSKALPLVTGPESISGAIFGLHPAVIARSYQGVVHKQVNLGHTLRVLGKREDRICGCVLQAAFPEEPEGGWEAWSVPDTPEESPHITCYSALFKQAHGVAEMLGQHLGGKVNMSVSMEMAYFLDEVGVYDPSSRSAFDRSAIPTNLKGYLFEDNDGRLGVRKNSRQPGLVLIPGGVSGRVWYSGYGYTASPAEETAGIESISATRREGLMVASSAVETPRIAPGMEVRWKFGEFNRGRVESVHMEGSHVRYGKTVTATPENPVLDILLPDGRRVYRRSSSVERKQ